MWFTHPQHPSAGIISDDWASLAIVLARVPHHWQHEGWRMAPDDLVCKKCGATNIPHAKPTVEVEKDARGLWVICASCGFCGKHEPA